MTFLLRGHNFDDTAATSIGRCTRGTSLPRLEAKVITYECSECLRCLNSRSPHATAGCSMFGTFFWLSISAYFSPLFRTFHPRLSACTVDRTADGGVRVAEARRCPCPLGGWKKVRFARAETCFFPPRDRNPLRPPTPNSIRVVSEVSGFGTDPKMSYLDGGSNHRTWGNLCHLHTIHAAASGFWFARSSHTSLIGTIQSPKTCRIISVHLLQQMPFLLLPRSTCDSRHPLVDPILRTGGVNPRHMALSSA